LIVLMFVDASYGQLRDLAKITQKQSIFTVEDCLGLPAQGCRVVRHPLSQEESI
jgi:hypothetical protein